ncbi:hypothetical protein TNCV_608691 [Trichonephila clavipes]|nr:hypothetical protein TNCV_608691 [Trichonephila clavipes]
MSDLDSDMDLNSKKSGYSYKSRSSRSGTPNSTTFTSEWRTLKNVMKRICIVEKGINKYESHLHNPTPGGPTNGHKNLLKMKRNERETLVRELQNLPPCTNPNCPDHLSALAESVNFKTK